MEWFYFITIATAVFLLIIMLTYVGVRMSYPTASEQIFPPSSNTCPDTWTFSDISGCIIPTNGVNAGVITINSTNTPGFTGGTGINFNDNEWTTAGTSTICAKKDWANKAGINWDGITNYNQCS